MTEVASAYVALMPSAKGFGAKLDRQVGGEVGKSGKRAGGLFGKAFGGLAGKAGAVGVGLAAAGFAKQAIGLEASFGKTMNMMGAVADVPKAQLNSLSDLAMQMGADTVFSANDAADAMLELAKNGIAPATIQAGALKSALTLAAAGGVSMEEAATTMGNAINAFGLKGKDSASVAAALAGAANASSASVQSLSEGLAQSATGAHAAGLSIQETTAALAAFETAGIKGSDAGTSLKTFLTRLVPSTDKARAAMEAYGLVAFDAKTATKKLSAEGIELKGAANIDNVSKAVGDMLVKRDGFTKGSAKLNKAVNDELYSMGIMNSQFEDGKGNFESLSTISGALKKSLAGLSQSERTSAMNTLFGSDASRAATVLMNQGAEGVKKYTKATSDRGAAQRAADAGMKGTAGAIEQLKGSLETVTLRFGQLIAPAVQAGLKGLTSLVNGIVPAVTSLMASFSKGGKGGGFTKFADSLKATGTAVLGFIKGLMPTLKGIFDQVVAVVVPAVSDIANLVTTQLLPAFKNVLPVLLPVAKFLLGIFGSSVVGLIKGFVQIIKGAINVIAGVFKLVTALVHGDWSAAWHALVQILKGALDIVIGAIKVWFNWGIFGIFKQGGKALLRSWRGLWDGVKGLGGKALTGLRSLISRGLDALLKVFIVGLKRILGFYKGFFTGLWGIARNGWKVLRSAFGGAVAAIKTVIVQGISRYVGFWKGLFTRMLGAVKTGLGAIIPFFKGLPARITKAVGGLGLTLFRKGKDLVSGLINGIRSMAGKLAKFVKKFVVDHIPGPVAKALGIASPSKVMAEQARWIPRGMVAGIDSQGHRVDSAMHRLSRRVVAGAPALDPTALHSTASGAQGIQLRGTLGIDRDGVAYLHGAARQEVHTHAAVRQAADRAAALTL